MPTFSSQRETFGCLRVGWLGRKSEGSLTYPPQPMRAECIALLCTHVHALGTLVHALCIVMHALQSRKFLIKISARN